MRMLEQLESRTLLSAATRPVFELVQTAPEVMATVVPETISFDVNGDGLVNAADEYFLRAHAYSLIAPGPAAYDLNGDGRCDATDQLMVRAAEQRPTPYDGHMVTVGGITQVFAPEPGDFGATWTVAVTPETADAVLYGPSGAPDYHAIQQGAIADCYFLSTLASLAIHRPEDLMSRLAWDGQGWAVRFDQYQSRLPFIVHVSNDFSVAYQAHTPAGIWAGVFEKAYAYFRSYDTLGSSLNTMHSLDYGFDSGPATQFGLATQVVGTWGGPASVLTQVQAALAANESATFDTISNATTLVASHSYAVLSVAADGSAMTIFNPWGFEQTVSLDVVVRDVTFFIVGA